MADIYLDYNATTPIDPQVAEAMLPFVQGGLNGLFGNPSSGHSFGVAARQGVETARLQVASMLGCDPDDLIFTSGGTEANNHAIKGVAEAYCQAPTERSGEGWIEGEDGRATTSSPPRWSTRRSPRSAATWRATASG